MSDPIERRAGRLAVLLGAALLASCIVTSRESPADPGGAPVRRALTAAFEVRVGTELVGYLREFGGVDSPQGHFYAVLNRWEQELGLIDERGRFWRHRPHQAEPEHVGSGPLEEGVRRLLDLASEPVLVPARVPI